MLEVFSGLLDEVAYVLDWCPSLVPIETACTYQGMPNMSHIFSLRQVHHSLL
jgi:hypothetical protein